MNRRRDFEIAYVGLKNDVHTLEYDIDASFFEMMHRQPPEGENLKVKVTLTFDKKPSFFLLKFDINGTLDVACDRCGDVFPLQLWDEFSLVVKLTDNDNEKADADEDADVVFIPRSESVLDVSEWIYEFIMLSIPIQKIHPDKADGTPGCNPDALKLLHRYEHREEEEQKEDSPLKGLASIDKNKFNNKK